MAGVDMQWRLLREYGKDPYRTTFIEILSFSPFVLP
jgi:hypothetical protein